MKQGLTLDQLTTVVNEVEEKRLDYIYPSNNLQVAYMDNEIKFYTNIGPQANQLYNMSNVFHHQVARYTGIPKSYYDMLTKEDPDLLVANINRRFLTDKEDSKRMVRTIGTTARAMLSSRYRIIDNRIVLTTVANILNSDLGKTLEINSCNVSDDFRLDVKLTSPRLAGEVKVGDIVRFGVSVSNSEIGFGLAKASPFIYRLACTNGMITSSSSGMETFTKRHVGKYIEYDETSFIVNYDADYLSTSRLEVAQHFSTTLSEILNGTKLENYLKFMREAANKRLLSNEDNNYRILVSGMGKDFNFTQEEKNKVYDHLMAGSDMTVYGLSNAITRAAHDVTSYARATDLEELGWKVLGATNGMQRKWLTIGAEKEEDIIDAEIVSSN